MRRQAGVLLVVLVIGVAVMTASGISTPAAAIGWAGFSYSTAPTVVGDGDSPAWAAGMTTDLGGPGLDIWNNNHFFDGEALVDVGTANAMVLTASDYGGAALIDAHGVLFTDLDGDGDEDLVEAMGRGNENRIFENDGGTLTPMPVGIFGDTIGRGRQPLALDFDADGDMDILVPNLDLRVPPVNAGTNSPSRIYLNNGSGTAWTVAPNTSGALYDGNLRIAQQTSTGPGTQQIVITHNSFTAATDSIATGSTSIQQATVSATVRTSVTHVRDVVIGDFDGDLHPEMVVARGNESTSAGGWPMQIFDLVEGASPIAVAPLPIDPLIDNCRSVAAGDFDNDGDLDIFGGCSQLQEGQDRNVLLLNDGTGVFTIAETDVLPASGALTAAGLAVGDIDGNGWLDVWVGTSYDSENGPDLLAMNGGGIDANYLSVDLQGSNPDAAGAQVFVGTGHWQVRETGHRVRRGQDARALHFGLGDATEVAPLEIRWPDGTFESCTVEGINRTVEIVQGASNCVAGTKSGLLATLAEPPVEPVVDVEVPESSIDGLGPVVPGVVAITGTASDDVSGVSQVRVRVKRESDGLYWDGAGWAAVANTWPLATGAETWALSGVPVDAGDYTVRAFAKDNDGRVERWADGRPLMEFVVEADEPPPPVDDVAPDTTIDDQGSPEAGVVTVSGSATDADSGVNRVRVRVRRDDGTYWNGAAWVTNANTWVTAVGTGSWSLEVDLVEGVYNVHAYAIDNELNVEKWGDGRPSVSFSVGAVFVDDVAPDTVIDGAVESAGVATISGTAQDADSEVLRVRVRVRRNADGTYWNGASWVTNANTWLTATGTDAWSLTGVPVTEGSYTATAYAIDSELNVETWADGRPTTTFDVDSAAI